MSPLDHKVTCHILGTHEQSDLGIESSCDDYISVRYRAHRASVADSTDSIEIRNRSALVAHLRAAMDRFNAHWTPPEPLVVVDELVMITRYNDHDPTCGRDVHIVIVKGWGVMGFCH